MSRIEEALRKAAAAPGSIETPHVQRDRFALAARPKVRVEDFAAEHPAAPQPRPSAPHARRPAAPDLREPVATKILDHVSKTAEGKLVSLQGMDRASMEQYRRVATTLHNMQQQHGIKVVMVTSSVPREGKTLTAANVALTLSESYGRRVLIIDGDLRRPFMHELFGISNMTGLGEGLRSPGTSLPVVQVTNGLSVLPAGRPDSDPMAGLASERMRTVLQEAADQFDWVILDTPPVGLISDARLLTGFVDGVVFVIGAGTTPYRLVERAVAEVGRERIIGTVLNRVNPSMSAPDGYYGQYYGAGEPGESS